jgi:NTE family protein
VATRRSVRGPAATALPGAAARPARLRVDLALQGGGSHGAFTWGVLDRLLQDETIEFGGISGTSAGAMNAVAVAAGLMEGGREGARQSLRRFWTRVGQIAPFAPPPNPWSVPAPLLPLVPWASAWGDLWGAVLRSASPYVLNPLNLNPLRKILEDTVDFARVRGCHKTALFIAATRVRTGQLHLFRQGELTADMVLASACLPLLFQAVKIGEEAYWDGGYAGNPSLLPLVADSASDDLLLVQINPSERPEVPTAAGDILERASEITFNASLLKELRQITLLQELAELAELRTGQAAAGSVAALAARLRRLRLHRVDGGAVLAPLGADTKTNTSPAFLNQLFDLGQHSADTWLQAHRRDLGQRSSYRVPVGLDAG